MLADLDLLLTAVFATADDLLPSRRRNVRRSVTDAEVVTLAVAQAVIDVPSDREFLAIAAQRLRHLFPKLPGQPGYWKRRLRLAETIEWLCAMFAQDSPGYFDDVVLLDSTPVECGRSVDTARGSSRRSKTAWAWNDTARAACMACAPGSPPNCSRSPPASGSTTTSANQLAPSPPPPPNPTRHQSSSRCRPARRSPRRRPACRRPRARRSA
jgi:hypothetical protein